MHQFRGKNNLKKKYYDLLKNTGILTIGSFSSKILIFFLIPIYTAALSTEEYGFYDLSYSTIQLLYPILSLNIVDALLRFALDKKNDIDEVYNICNKFTILSCFLMTGFLALYCVAGNSLEVGRYAIYIVAYYCLYAYNSFFLQLAKSLDAVKSIAITGIISAVSLFGLTFVILKYTSLGLTGFYIANIISQGLAVLYYAIVLRIWRYSRFKKSADKELERRMVRYCLPLLVTTLCWWANSSSDRYVVTYICGIGVSGLLSVAYKIPNIISVITGVFTQAWQISAIKEYDSRGDDDFYLNTFFYLNMFVCTVVAITIPLTKIVATVLFDESYYEAWKFIPFLLLGALFNAGSGYLGPILNAGYDVRAVAKSGILGMILNVILNIVLTYGIGAQGVTIATAVASFAIYYIRKRAAKNIFFGHKYNKLILVWILLFISAIAYTFFEQSWISVATVVFIAAIFLKDFRYMIHSFLVSINSKE